MYRRTDLPSVELEKALLHNYEGWKCRACPEGNSTSIAFCHDTDSESSTMDNIDITGDNATNMMLEHAAL